MHRINFVFSVVRNNLVLPITVLLTILLCMLLSAAPAFLAEWPAFDATVRLMLVCLVISLFLTNRYVKSEPLNFEIPVLLLGMFLTGAAFLALKETPFNFRALAGDQGLRTAYVTKLAGMPGYIDFAYKGLPSFYPPLYFYVLGKISALLHLPPYMMLKYGMLTTLLLLPYLTQKLWSLVIDGRTAATIALFSSITYNLQKPEEWLSLLLFVPWWLHFVDGIGRKHTDKWQIGRLALGGVVGSILFQVHYYWFFLGGAKMVLDLVMKLPSFGSQDRPEAPSMHKFQLLGVTAALSSFYWAPYLFSMFKTGGWQVLQARYMEHTATHLPLPFFEPTIRGVLFLGGLTYVLITFRKNLVSAAMLKFLITSYAWLALGYVGIIAANPFVSDKSEWLILYILCISVALSLVHLWRNKTLETWFRGNGRTLFSVFLVLLVLFFGEDTATDLEQQQKETRNRVYPAGLISAFGELTNNEYFGKVVLSDFREIPIFVPVYTFLVWTGHYSHPAARFHDRVDFLRKLSALDDPELFAAALMNNKWSKIDYILLQDQNILTLSFINAGTGRDFDRRISNIFFPRELFSKHYFRAKRKKNQILFMPRYENNPIILERLSLAELDHYSPSQLKLIQRLCREFDHHITIDDPSSILERIGGLT